MKKFTNSSALSGLRNPHRNSLPGPVRDTANRIGEAMRNIFANVFSGRSDSFFFMTKASVLSLLLAPRILAIIKPLLRKAVTKAEGIQLKMRCGADFAGLRLGMKAGCMSAPRAGEHVVSITERLTRVLCRKGRLPHHRIEIRLHNLNQLFNSIDPSPFHEKDLDHDAEEFIVGGCRSFIVTTP